MAKMLFKLKKTLKDYFLKNHGINFIYRLFGTEENIAKAKNVMVLLVKSVALVIQKEKTN